MKTHPQEHSATGIARAAQEALPQAARAGRRAAGGWMERRLRDAVLGRLEGLSHGVLEFEFDGVRKTVGHSPVHPTTKERLVGRIAVRDPELWWSVALRGSVGAGEAFARGLWTSEDPVAVVRIFALNRDRLEGLEGGLARLSLPLLRAYHALRPNSRGGARRNIAAHYDLGNDFFALMLDETRMYSAGIYEGPGTSLHEASVAKLDRIGRKLQLEPGDHLLEIGTGWGGLALHMAERFGCRVTTTTISRAQYEVARERIERAGLGERVTVLLEDYRELRGGAYEGRFDKLVSVEMIEAIGWRQYPTFFETCARLLKPSGSMLVQAITIQDQHFDAARREVDFIKRHIFPGCCIPSPTALLGAMTAASDLRLAHLEDITDHYARTLADWRSNIAAEGARIRALGYGEEFVRSWDWYLAYCEGGFRERVIQDLQMLFVKPLDRAEHLLGSL